MKQSIAAAPAETWNQKNLPSDVEQFGGAPSRKLIAQLPAAAINLARRRPGATILSVVAVLAVVGLGWYYSKEA